MGTRRTEQARFLIVSVGIIIVAAALVLLPRESAVLLVGAGVIVTLALIDPIWAIYAAVLSVPLQQLLLLPGGLSYTQATLLLVAASWGLHTLAHPERSVRMGRPAAGLVVLVGALAYSTIFTPYSQLEGLKETARWGGAVLVYLATLNALVSPPGAHNEHSHRSIYWRMGGLVAVLLLAGLANALPGIWQFLTASGPPSFLIAGGRFARAYGTFGQPNSFAGALNMSWPLAVALLAGAVWHLARLAHHNRLPLSIACTRYGIVTIVIVAAGGASFVLLAALLASFSRGGWLGAMAGALVMAMLAAVLLLASHGQTRQPAQPARRGTSAARAPLPLQQAAITLAAMVVGGGGLLLLLHTSGLLPAPLAQRLGSIVRNVRLFDVRNVQTTPENFAIVERMAHLQAGWDMVTHHPLSGVGPGSYSLAYEGHGSFQASPHALHPWYTSQGHAHNYYLHIAAEAGIGGLAAYLLLIGLLVAQARATLRRVNHWFARSAAIGCCGIIGAVAMHNLFENLHVLNMGVYLGAVWGLLTALEQADKRTHTGRVRVGL